MSLQIHEQVLHLQKQRQYKQKSKEWYEIRKNIFTASTDIADILGESEFGGTIEKVIKKKISGINNFTANKFTIHGNKYEKIAIQIYENRYNKKVIEFGLLKHPTINCLGASPDGITTDGRMVEVKVPYYRIPNGKIKQGYFIQMQTQMEVCNLNICDFFEIKIVEYKNKQEYDNDTYNYNLSSTTINNIFPKCDKKFINLPDNRRTKQGLEKGMLGKITNLMNDIKGNEKYLYPPINLSSTEQYNWLIEKQKNISSSSNKLNSVLIQYWKLVTSSYNEVKRDKNWWKMNNVENKLKNTWKIIEEEQQKKLKVF